MLQHKSQRTGLYVDALSLGKYLGLQKSVVKEFAVTDVRVKTRSETDKTEVREIHQIQQGFDASKMAVG